MKAQRGAGQPVDVLCFVCAAWHELMRWAFYIYCHEKISLQNNKREKPLQVLPRWVSL